jgi:hypothetical protein
MTPPHLLLAQCLQVLQTIGRLREGIERLGDASDLPYTEDETMQILHTLQNVNKVVEAADCAICKELYTWGL